MTGDDLWQALLEEYSRMGTESKGPHWREEAWWVLHPRWRAPLWQLCYGCGSAPLMTMSPVSGEERLMGIRMMCGMAYARPRLTCDPQDCLPRQMTVRSLSWAEMMAR